MNTELRKKGWKDMNQRLEASMPRDRNRRIFIWWFFGAVILIAAVVTWIYNNKELKNDSSQKEVVVKAEIENQNSLRSYKETKNNISYSDSEEPQQTSQSAEQIAATLKGEINSVSQEPETQSRANSQAQISVDKTKKLDRSGDVFEMAGKPDNFQNHTFARQLPLVPLPLLKGTDDLNLKGYRLPDVNKILEINPAKEEIKNSYFIDLSSGIRTASPVSYVGQVGAGMRFSLSDNWDYMMSLGLGIEGQHETAIVNLKERKSNDEFAEDVNSGGQFSNNNSNRQVQLDLQNNFFAYSGFHVSRRIHSRWSLRFGLEVAYRFYNQYEGRNQFLLETGNSTANFETLRFSELEEKYVIFNRWDIRPVVGINYALQSRFNLELSYRHGLNPLLAYPADNTPELAGRFLQLGVQYQF